MSKGLCQGKVVIEEETEDDNGKVTDKLNSSVAAIDLKNRIVVEESLFESEAEDEASNMSMVVDDDDTKPSSQFVNKNNSHGGKEFTVDESGSEALDLSFIPCSIPLKKRKISNLPNSNSTHDEDKKNSNYRSHQKAIARDTSAFNQSTHNYLNNFHPSPSHFPFTLRAIPSASSSTSSNCKPLALVKNQQPQQSQHYHQQHQHNLHQFNHHSQHQKLIQYQFQQQKQDFILGNKSAGLGSSTSGQTKGMSCRRPGFITCSICNATKYYSHVQRRFGQYSCEPCSKFMKRFLRDPKIFTCSQKGHCTIGKPSGEQEPRGVSVNRCKACWLKICLEKFILDSETRLAIDKYYAPKFSDSSDSSPSNDTLSSGLGGDGDGGVVVGVNGVLDGPECNNVNIEEGTEGRLNGKGNSVEGDRETGKSSQSGHCDRIETNSCDTTISPPPLPFPQRKRKPKNESATSSSTSSPLSTNLSSSSSLSTTPTTNLLNNNNTPTTGESIPLSTSQSGNSRNKEKNHHHSPHQLQNQQYHTSTHHSDNRHQQRESSTFFGSQSGAHFLTEPLCLTTSGRRSDLFSSGVLGNLSSTSRLSSASTFSSGGYLGLTPPLGPRYPWSHRRKDDYESFVSNTAQTLHGNLTRRGSDDDLNDLYQGDYSLTSPDLVLGRPFGSVSHFRDINGEGDVDDNIMVMGSPATPPPPPARCGKCIYCLPTVDEKANVVVVKENVGPIRCRYAEMMSSSKLSQTLSNSKGGGGENVGGVTSIASSTISTATSTTAATGNSLIDTDNSSTHNNRRPVSTTSEGDENIIGDDNDSDANHNNEGQEEETVHSSTSSSNLINLNPNYNRRIRKDRRGHSKGGDKEEGVGIGGGGGGGQLEEESMINDDENDDRESRESNTREGYRKRIVSGDDEDQGVSMRFHQGGRSSKSNKSVMFNKPYKKILINEHFVNTPSINNQASNSNNYNNLLSPKDLSGPVISPDSNFLSEILNANSPFL